jgi:S-adenosylmethionine hydrolase
LNPSGIVTLTTDFGFSDTYVGQVKGALLAEHGELHVVDLCHGVQPGAVLSGAYLLETGHAVFPPGTVHVAVVDPGVGTGRRALAAHLGDHFFVAPDNGLLSRVLDRLPLYSAHSIDEPSLRRPGGAATFDGRDLFAPAAARLAAGEPLDRLGPAAAGIVRLEPSQPELRSGVATEVPVLHVDRFGNVTLDAHVDRLAAVLGHRPEPGDAIRAQVAGRRIDRFLRTFADGGKAGPFLLLNSSDYLEIAIDGGRADQALGLEAGGRALLTVGR